MSILPVRGGTAANGKQSFTSAQAADQLTRESNGWSRDADGGTTVTYAFRSSGASSVAGSTFSQFNAQQITATELALQSWADVANIRFVRAGGGSSGPDAYSNQASILFGDYSAASDDGAAYANYPGNRGSFSSAGDVWVRLGSGLSYNANPVVGDYGQQVLVHEIGHALGLSHPGDYDASDETDPTYDQNGVYYEDSRLYTVMSYFASSNVGASLGAFAAAAQMDDIAAIQKLYGANMATRSGDTTYGFNSTADRPYYAATGASSQLVFTVWDGGGYDRLDFSGYNQAASIDLHAGAFSDVGGSLRNVAIAVGVTIEEAIGGSGNDTIIANDAGDALIGGAGIDSLVGGAGNDHLYGGGRNAIAGDGGDFVQGGGGSDYLQGNAGADNLSGGDGSDRLFGGQDNDQIYGDAGNDTVNGNLGDDYISGGDGNDSLRGGQGDDRLLGDAGNDVLFGDVGNDRLQGGAGIDIMTGGPGADAFAIGDSSIATTGELAWLIDTIMDFEDGTDRLTANAVLSEVRYANFTPATAPLADVLAYAHQLLDPPTAVGIALAVGYGGDTLLFTHDAVSNGVSAVRLLAIANPQQITLGDFV